MTKSLLASKSPVGGFQKMSVACMCINNEPVSPSLLGNEEETNVFNSRFNKHDGTSFHQIQSKTPRSDASCAGKLDQRVGRPVSVGFPCQQPQKQDEAHAACTHPSNNELSCSAMTQDKELLRHPVVEQLAMIGTRLAIPEQDHQASTNNLRWPDSRAISEELPRQTQQHLVVRSQR